MELVEVKEHASRLSMWAYMATVTATGRPHVAVVHPCWTPEGTLAVFTGTGSKKVRNLRSNDAVSLHYTVDGQTGFDSLIIDGAAVVHGPGDRKRELWGEFDYPLEQFGGQGGPDDPETVIVEISPARALLLKSMGTAGRDEWRA